MNLAEELLLCSIGDDGYIASSHKIAAAIGGALIADLAIAGRARFDGDTLTLADGTPTGDPLLDEVIKGLDDAETTEFPASRMMSFFGKQVFPRVYAAVVESGAAQKHEGGRSWMYVVRKPDTLSITPTGEEPRRRVREALLGTQDVDARTAALAALVVATDYHKVLVPKDGRKAAAQRGQALGASDGAARAAAQAIAGAQAAAGSMQSVPTTV